MVSRERSGAIAFWCFVLAAILMAWLVAGCVPPPRCTTQMVGWTATPPEQPDGYAPVVYWRIPMTVCHTR